MSASVRRVGILCVVLAASCAGAGEPPPTLAGRAGSVAVAQFPPGSYGTATPASPGMAPSSAFAIQQMPENEDPAPAGQAPEPPLDVATLKLRLRETSALGVFAKLALRSGMGDLMQQLRWHHLGSHKTSVADLRLLYDQFVFKVLSLIRDGDPHLARAIAVAGIDLGRPRGSRPI